MSLAQHSIKAPRMKTWPMKRAPLFYHISDMAKDIDSSTKSPSTDRKRVTQHDATLFQEERERCGEGALVSQKKVYRFRARSLHSAGERSLNAAMAYICSIKLGGKYGNSLRCPYHHYAMNDDDHRSQRRGQRTEIGALCTIHRMTALHGCPRQAARMFKRTSISMEITQQLRRCEPRFTIPSTTLRH